MAKQQDIPNELREFNKIFERLSRRHDYSRVFDDFLTICMGWFGAETMNHEWQEGLKGYNDEEKKIINELVYCMIHTYDKIFKNESMKWYDFFGHYYEVLASSGKKSALGQFFTPPHLCDLMTLLQCAEGMAGKKVDDCACGSGRTLLSFNAHHPGNFVFGNDVDMMCCKMTCINLMIHGAEGEIACMNSLSLGGDFRGAWAINPYIHTKYKGIPHIIKIDDFKETYHYKMWHNEDGSPVTCEPKTKKEVEVQVEGIVHKLNNQLTIF